jgi:hypothetical protein
MLCFIDGWADLEYQQSVWQIQDVYLGSRILIFTRRGSRIPDPKTATKERGEKIFFSHNFSCSHEFHKIANYFSFEVLKKKIWPNFLRISELFTQKIVTKLSKIWIWNPGSEIRDPRSGIWDPGSGKNLFRIQGSKRHRIPDLDPQHCQQS